MDPTSQLLWLISGLPITYEQIKAWKELTDTPMTAWEVEAVKRLDGVYMRVNNV
jgi:hypothetical protein